MSGWGLNWAASPDPVSHFDFAGIIPPSNYGVGTSNEGPWIKHGHLTVVLG